MSETGPPTRRTALGAALETANRDGRLHLQCCPACGAVVYPPRELCPVCLTGDLAWDPVAETGTLLSLTAVHASLSAYFKARAPWLLGLVALDCGPRLIGHRHRALEQTGQRVRMRPVDDAAGRIVFAILPDGMKDTPRHLEKCLGIEEESDG